MPTISQIQSWMLQNKLIYLKGEYVNKYSGLWHICQCGTINVNHLNGLQKGKRCGMCNRKTYSDDLYDRRIALIPFIQNLSLDKFLVFRCSCGEEEYFPHVYSGLFTNYICPVCDTRKDRSNKRYIVWKDSVKSLHPNCYVCDSDYQLHAHHVISRDLDISLQYEISNGLSLCRAHHADFHIKYGTKTNKIMLDEYKSTVLCTK